MSNSNLLTDLLQGFVVTNSAQDRAVAEEAGIANAVEVSRLSAAVDTAIYQYTLMAGNMYMASFFDNNYGEKPMLNVRPTSYLHTDTLATYANMWKMNFELMSLWQQLYALANDTCVIRVYNNEPIIVSTPSGAGYFIIHPSVQPNLVVGTDEYGAFYEAKVGGLTDVNGRQCRLVGSNYVSHRNGGLGYLL